MGLVKPPGVVAEPFVPPTRGGPPLNTLPRNSLTIPASKNESTTPAQASNRRFDGAETLRGESALDHSALDSAVNAPLGRLAQALGLPRDSLSAALLSFVRFFGMPLESRSLAALRREALSAPTPPSEPDAKAACPSLPEAGAEAKALAAVSGALKSIRLSAEALNKYARLLTEPAAAVPGPPAPKAPDGADPPERQFPNEGGGNSGAGGRNSGGSQKQDRRTHKARKNPGPEELRELFTDFMRIDNIGKDENRGLLSLLNRIPGKDGQRWIVWPFNLTNSGTDLQVVVRLLIKEPLSLEPGRLILDAWHENPALDTKTSWRFILDRGTRGELKADVSVFPPAANPEALKKEAAGLFAGLGLSLEVSYSPASSGGLVPFASLLSGEVLPYVNKKV
jgi:hypothetical protein